LGLTHGKAEGLLFREKEAKSFCLFAPDRFWPSPLDGELTKVFWSFFSKKDCFLMREAHRKTALEGS
jgi:hypothetical protein